MSQSLDWDVGAWPISGWLFSDRKWPPVLYRKKLIHNWVSPPHPKRDLETQTTYGPHTWQRGLSDWRSLRSPVLVVTRVLWGEDSRQRGEVLRAKSTFSWLLLNRKGEARALCGFQHHKGETLFCFLFSDPITVGLTTLLFYYRWIIICNEPFWRSLSYRFQLHYTHRSPTPSYDRWKHCSSILFLLSFNDCL